MTLASAARPVQQEESGSGEPMLVRLSRILPFKGQPRRYFNQKGLEEMAEEFMDPEVGQQTPIQLCKYSEIPGMFVLTDGERRWRSWGIVRDRTNTDPLVKCFIDPIRDERHHFRKSFIANLHREDLVPVDEAAAYARLYRDSTERSHAAKVKDVAHLVKKSTTHIENYLAVHQLPEGVKRFMNPELPRNEQLSVTAAIYIAKGTSNPALQLQLAQEAIERDMGVAEVQMLVNIRTGQTGHGLGGRMRKPSDDYKLLKSFIGSITAKAKRFASMHVSDLYTTRDDEYGDRERDAEEVEMAIHHLKGLLKEIKTEE